MIFVERFLISILLILQLKETLVWTCSAGPRYGYRHSYSRTLTPLVRGQYLPAMSETTIGASGPPRKPIKRNSEEFSNLVYNMNPDIVFLDEEADGSDRIMTQRCKDRLDTLATLVKNYAPWANVKVRVTEAWESAQIHAVGSLHYEGRAVDLTTQDRDTTKYGMLARLAVEAGFDWVHYKSKYYVHASVRSDEADDGKYGGCFPGEALSHSANNRSIPLKELSVGDQVLAVDRNTGHLVYSDVIMMLDKQENVSAQFLEITTAKSTLTLTKNHLVFVMPEDHLMSPEIHSHTWSNFVQPIYAEDVKVGQYVFIRHSITDHKLTPSSSRVVSVKHVVRKGVYAPLTSHGTIVVGDTVASCYSSLSSEPLAHASFQPVRTFEFLRETDENSLGVHWYAKTLIKFAEFFLPSSLFRFF